MRIMDLLDRKSIDLNGQPKTKDEAILQMGELMAKSGKLNDTKAYTDGLFEREKESTTAVGEGIAIPHYKGDAVNAPGLAAMVIRDGVDFDSIDGQPVKLIFAIAAPNVKENVHLDVLSKLSVLMMDEGFISKLISAKTVDEFTDIINEADSEAPDEEKSLSDGNIKILAVTSCPTGIAHTYMAEEGLYKAAQKAGCTIKVETRGSGGAKNLLTKEEIKMFKSLLDEKYIYSKKVNKVYDLILSENYDEALYELENINERYPYMVDVYHLRFKIYCIKENYTFSSNSFILLFLIM